MIRMRVAYLAPLLSMLAAAVSGGCSSADDGGTPPAGVQCASVEHVTNSGALASAVASATPGSCVVVSGNLTSSTALSVKSGVILVGASGARPSITVTDASASGAITLDAEAQVGNLDVLAAPRNGIVVTAPRAKVFDVKVTGAKGAALVVSVDAAPSSGSPDVTIASTILEQNVYGLYVRGAGAHVVMTGGRVAESASTSLSGGVGVIAAEGAQLTLDGVTVEKNEGTGVLLDGAATRGVIKNATVSENHERGVWAQGLKGTLDSPALTVQDTEVVKNRIVGVGGVELTGIIVVGGSVKETVASPVPTNLATTEPIGDGIGIYGGSTDFKIDRTNFERNDRAAGVVDGTETGIIVVGGSPVEPSSTGLKFVVQNVNGAADIQIPDASKSVTDKPLGISAPKIELPATL